METFELWAKPWWVNLFILFPFAAYFFWRKKLTLARPALFFAAVFGMAFGFVEASVVVYLRSATGFLTLKNGMLLNVVNFQSFYQKPQGLLGLPASLFSIELYREAATIVMLVAVACLAGRTWRDRLAAFFWAFAFWDIFYYVGLYLTIRWPSALTDPDILFLIPAPWVSQVWYPLLISLLLILAVLLGNKKQSG
jgi:hypothetical protein